MLENLLNKNKGRKNKLVYIILLFLSFMWVCAYTTSETLVSNFNYGYGNLFEVHNFSNFISILIVEAFLGWVFFEILFYIYRYVLTFKVYSFLVPAENLKAEGRFFFAVRNIFYGVFCNLCFLFPYIDSFIEVANILITLVVLIVYASYINKTYSEPIVRHFVFKVFCYPVLIFEFLSVTISVLGVLL